MNAIKLPKYAVGITYTVASTIVAIGVWIFFHGNGKNGFDVIPLFWLFAIVSAPILSTMSVIALWHQRVSTWRAAIATLLLLPQCVVWYYAVKGVLHYLGFVNNI